MGYAVPGHRTTRSGGVIGGIKARINLPAVAHAVAIGVRVEGIGPGVVGVHKGSAIALHPVQQAVPIAVRDEGIGSVALLLSITGAVRVGVHHRGIGPVGNLHRIIHPVTVEVTRSQLGQVTREKLLLVGVVDAVSVRVRTRTCLSLNGRAVAVAIGVGVEDRLAGTGTEARNVTDATEVTSTAIASGGIESKTDVSRGLGPAPVLSHDDPGVKPATFTEVVDSVGARVPARVLVGRPGRTGCGEVGATYDGSDIDLNAVVKVLGEGERSIGIVELEGEGQVKVVTAEVNAPVARLPVHIDPLDDERVRIVQHPVAIKIDILRQGPGEIVAADIETVRAAVENIACRVSEVCQSDRSEGNQENRTKGDIRFHQI